MGQSSETYVFTMNDREHNKISINVRDMWITINGNDHPARLLILPQYDGFAQYYVGGNTAILYRLEIRNPLGRGLALPAVMLNVLARDARARNLSVIRLLDAQVLAG
jgi:hypothetical protein